MIKEWSDEAWEEFLEQVKKDRNFLKRIEKILKDIERNGYTGMNKFKKDAIEMSCTQNLGHKIGGAVFL